MENKRRLWTLYIAKQVCCINKLVQFVQKKKKHYISLMKMFIEPMKKSFGRNLIQRTFLQCVCSYKTKIFPLIMSIFKDTTMTNIYFYFQVSVCREEYIGTVYLIQRGKPFKLCYNYRIYEPGRWVFPSTRL